jgi:uncharacterized membrane protein
MNFSAVTEASLPIQIHLATVVPAFVLGTWLIFFSKKGSPIHRTLGKIYLVLMTITAITTIFVRQLNPGHLSWLHLFIPLTAWGVFNALWSIRRRDFKSHQRSMLGLYLGGLLIAGGLTFLPGRVMHRLFFGDPASRTPPQSQTETHKPTSKPVRGTRSEYLT